MMKENKDYIWYACYGSNLNINRFLYYIKGGYFKTTNSEYKGCTDKNLSDESDKYIINNSLYFSKESKSWQNKSVAFISAGGNKAEKTLCRLYLLTRNQFTEVFQQENGEISDYSKLSIDFDKAKKNGSLLVGPDDKFIWYGRLLYLGMHKAFPVYSFTAKWNDNEIEYAMPGENYLAIIILGIKMSFKLSVNETFDYLKNKQGIKNFWKEDELLNLIKGVYNG